MSITNPIAFKGHVTQGQIQKLKSGGIRVSRTNSGFSPVFAWCRNRSEEDRVNALNQSEHQELITSRCHPGTNKEKHHA